MFLKSVHTTTLVASYVVVRKQRTMKITTIFFAAALSSALIATTVVEGASIQQTSEVWTTGAYTGGELGPGMPGLRCIIAS